MSIIQTLVEKLKPELKDEEKQALVDELSEEVKETETVEKPVEEEAKAEESKEEIVEEQKEEVQIPIPDAKDEVKAEVIEEEAKGKEEVPVPALQESAAVSKLIAQQELLRKENEELQAKIEALAKEKALIDSQKKLDSAMAEGWLTPAMLKENADGAESVFVTMAKDYPEMFERLKLVMAPKIVKKTGITEESNSLSEVLSDDEAKFEMINKYAADHKIPYIEAARIIGGTK